MVVCHLRGRLMRVLLVTMLALLPIQLSSAAKHASSTTRGCEGPLPIQNERSVLSLGRMLTSAEWISLAAQSITEARRKMHADCNGYKFEFDVNKNGGIERVKVFAPHDASQAKPESFFSSEKLLTPVPMKNNSGTKRRLRLTCQQFPSSYLEFAD